MKVEYEWGSSFEPQNMAFKMEVQRGYMGERGECIHLKWTEDEPRNPKFNGGKGKWRHLVEC